MPQLPGARDLTLACCLRHRVSVSIRPPSFQSSENCSSESSSGVNRPRRLALDCSMSDSSNRSRDEHQCLIYNLPFSHARYSLVSGFATPTGWSPDRSGIACCRSGCSTLLVALPLQAERGNTHSHPSVSTRSVHSRPAGARNEARSCLGSSSADEVLSWQPECLPSAWV